MGADATAGCALYRLLNTAGDLLYGGIAKNPRARFSKHAATKSWWPEVSVAVVEFYACREAAQAAETAVFVYEHPRYNIATSGPWLHDWLRRFGSRPQPVAVERWAIETGRTIITDALREYREAHENDDREQDG